MCWIWLKSQFPRAFPKERSGKQVGSVMVIYKDGRTDRHETDGSHKERYIEAEQDSAKRTGREQ
jgi:hypothetical protein